MSLPIGFAILTFSAYCFRRLRLEWLAWRPGRIQVPQFSVANLTRASPAQLTTAFRDRLAGMRLASSGAAPAAQQETDFLSVLGADQASSSKILGTLVRLLKAASPAYAYEISGVVVQREDTPPRYTVSLQVLRLPSEGTPPVEVTDTDLDRAIRRAADCATAVILPQTRLCKGPWIAWRRFVMPGTLFGAYEDACEHEAERRYDQALDLYYRALEQDPMNRMLRLQLAQLQEKLHLFLEALATYTGIIDAARPADTELPAGLYSFSAERERWRALLIARYRRIVLLAEETFVEQWFEKPAGQRHGDHDHRRELLRVQLTPWLRKRLSARQFQKLMQAKPDGSISPDQRERKRLSKELADFAVVEIDKLRGEVPRAWPLLRPPPLTRRTLELTKLCIEQRAMVGQEDANPDVTDEQKRVDRVERSRNPRRWLAILLLPDVLGKVRQLAEETVKRLERKRGRDLQERVRNLQERVHRVERFRRLRRWQEHYNAACAFAIPLLLREVPEGVEETLAGQAVNRLELAAACADSSFIARRRDWVTSEDPDLDGLRPLPHFKKFEAQYFPSAASRPPRPRKNVRKLVELRYTLDVLATAARSWETVWRTRAQRSQEEEDEDASRWWSDEQEVWRHIRDVALNHNPRSRLALMKAAQEGHLRYRVEPLDPAFKQYSDDPLIAAEGEVEHAAKKEITRLHRLLEDVVDLIDTRQLQGLTTSFSALHLFDADPNVFPPALRGRFCRWQATTWHGLGEWLMAPQDSSTDELRASFERDLRHAERLWKWRGRSVRLREALWGEGRRGR